MGTPFNIDTRLNKFIDLTEILTLELIEILTDNYNKGKLLLGNNSAENPYGKKVFFTITESEFENLFLIFKYKNAEFGYPFEILINSKGNDSPVEFKISLDDVMLDKLPKKMKKEITDRFYKLLSE